MIYALENYIAVNIHTQNEETVHEYQRPPVHIYLSLSCYDRIS